MTPIPGFELFYAVTNDGRVFSLRKQRFLLPGSTSRGYLTVGLYDGTRAQSHTVHSLVAEAFLGPRPDGFTVNHIDGNKANNDVRNLEYASHSDNIRHAYRNGLKHPIEGSRHVNSKLTERQVLSIRRIAAWRSRHSLRPRFVSNRAMAQKFGVDPTVIADIINRKMWKHVA